MREASFVLMKDGIKGIAEGIRERIKEEKMYIIFLYKHFFF